MKILNDKETKKLAELTRKKYPLLSKHPDFCWCSSCCEEYEQKRLEFNE